MRQTVIQPWATKDMKAVRDYTKDFDAGYITKERAEQVQKW